MLGSMVGAAVHGSGADETADYILSDDENDDLAQTFIEDAGDALDTDLDDFADAFTDVDSVSQIENTAEEQLRADDEDSWFAQALEAFWNGFSGANY